jgi:hypothetical protein
VSNWNYGLLYQGIFDGMLKIKFKSPEQKEMLVILSSSFSLEPKEFVLLISGEIWGMSSKTMLDLLFFIACSLNFLSDLCTLFLYWFN